MRKFLKGQDDGKCRRQYLSVPALNQINSELYLEGRRSIFNSTFDLTKNEALKNGFRKTRSKSLGRRSSTNETSESAPYKLIDIDIEQRTSHPTLLPVHNVRSASSHSISRSSRDEVPRLNGSTSPMTQANSVLRGPAEPDGSAGAPLTNKNSETTELISTSRSSKARQKKFHRHFKQVDIEEKVLNYYSCALVGDILLQGHLYITENFFAFYSNVFGYVTKLLIPTVDVLKISKEKTAKIIPNAVGISTEDEKHVFGSLLSRDSTYKFMLQVWKAANSSNLAANLTPPPTIKTELPSDEDSSLSTCNEEPSSFISNMTTGPSSENFQKLLPSMKRKSLLVTSMEAKNSNTWNFLRDRILLVGALIVLVLLFASAGYLVYKIAIIQNHFNDLTLTPRSSELYEEILKWQTTLHSTSANKVYEFLNANLNQIIKVRLSLEALSMLILPRNSKNENTNSKSESTKFKESKEERESPT